MPAQMLSRAYPEGAVLVEVDRFIFSLKEQPDGSYSLVRKTAAGAVQPLVDFVSGLAFDVTGRTAAAGFFQIEQVGVWLSVEAPSDAPAPRRSRSRVSDLRQIAKCAMRGERGIALIMVILFTAFLSVLGLGLLLAVFMDRLATGNMNGSVAMLHAADAGIELAARDLAETPDWDVVLSGAMRGSFTDGAPGGARETTGRRQHRSHRRDQSCSIVSSRAAAPRLRWTRTLMSGRGATTIPGGDCMPMVRSSPWRLCCGPRRVTSPCGLRMMRGSRMATRNRTPQTRNPVTEL